MKRLISNALGFATTFIALSGLAMAQNQSTGMKLMAGNTELVSSLDTKFATQGQAVTVKLTDSIKTPEGVELPRGTELLGRVDGVKASDDKSPSTLVLTFNQARLKNDKTVAVKATLVNVASADGVNEMPGPVGPDDTFDEAPGAIRNVALHSAVKDNTSGTLTDAHKNIRLAEGTQFLVAVGVEPSQQSAAAE
jgi:hypothetical protein